MAFNGITEDKCYRRMSCGCQLGVVWSISQLHSEGVRQERTTRYLLFPFEHVSHRHPESTNVSSACCQCLLRLTLALCVVSFYKVQQEKCWQCAFLFCNCLLGSRQSRPFSRLTST